MKGLVISWCVLCAGIGGGYVAFSMAVSTKALLESGLKVPARVIQLVESRSRSNEKTSITYHPVFKYEVDGKTYERKSNLGANPPSYEVGEVTTLTIDPKDPSNYISSDFWGRWGGNLLVGAGSVFFSLLAGIDIFLKLRKSNKLNKIQGT